eukprot:Skav203553  [mRNA]  locus=scaffold3576:71617:78927:+ [translate_table: standard]
MVGVTYKMELLRPEPLQLPQGRHGDGKGGPAAPYKRDPPGPQLIPWLGTSWEQSGPPTPAVLWPSPTSWACEPPSFELTPTAMNTLSSAFPDAFNRPVKPTLRRACTLPPAHETVDDSSDEEDTFAIGVARVCLCTGWILSLCFLKVFCWPVETKEEQDKIFQRACKISVAMDVGGKFCTYLCAAFAVEEAVPKWLGLLEFATTLAEAMQKYAHAARAHARETSSNPSLSSYLLADDEP